MNITFLTNLSIMTYEHYLKQPMPMIERVVNKKIARNPELIKTLRKTSHPLFWKYRHIIHSEDATSKKFLKKYTTWRNLRSYINHFK